MKQNLEKIFHLGYSQYKGLGTSNGKEVADEISNLAKQIKTQALDYSMNSDFSIGIGRWNAVPWIRVFYSDLSPSAKDGVYIVYLFNASGTAVYLTLNQGTTDSSEDERIKTRDLIQNKISSRSFLKNSGNLNFGDTKNYGQAAIFYKEYQATNFPSEEKMNEDLLEMLEIYKECKDKGLLKKELNNKLEKVINNGETENTLNFDNPNSFTLSKLPNQVRMDNYVLSLLAKPFVILTGNSGTGKTRISKDFANWLGKMEQGKIVNKLLVPVGADWTDNTKILGFYNPLKKEYQSTAILDFILLAQKNKEIPFFLILDEMNLSHVERYFSDFLSAMESGESIPLYKKNCDIDSTIPEDIKIPENLFVTGTVNIDETTYMFSPKVLDRANVIEFIPAPEDVLSNFKEDLSPINISPVNDGSAEGYLALAKEVRKTKILPEKADKAVDILTGISDILIGTGFEFAYRTAKEIRLYLIAAAKLAEKDGRTLGDEDYIKLMDEQLLQKILPKIHGNRSQIGDLLRKLSEFCETQKKIIDNKEFGLIGSKKKIDRMIKQLETSQFASFI